MPEPHVDSRGYRLTSIDMLRGLVMVIMSIDHVRVECRSPPGPFPAAVLYPLLPWIGVMLLGFGLAELFGRPAVRRNARLMKLGVTMTAAFLILRAVDIYDKESSRSCGARRCTGRLCWIARTESILLATGGSESSRCRRPQSGLVRTSGRITDHRRLT
jgi:hypothetical protein